MELGFRIKRQDFKATWVLADGTELSQIGLEKVQLAKQVLEEKMKVTETLAEREKRMKKEEEDFEKNRKVSDKILVIYGSADRSERVEKRENEMRNEWRSPCLC